MSESAIIGALAYVKGPSTLFAFVALLFLLVFRTPTVADWFFKLAMHKLTREHYYRLLNRFMLYAFVAFVVVVLLSVAGNVAAAAVAPGPISQQEFRAEVARVAVDEATRENAAKAYQQALAQAEQAVDSDGIKKAINSLQESLKLIPTQSANYTLALLYDRLGERDQAEQYALRARQLAANRDDSVATARIDWFVNSLEDRPTTIGPKDALPPGGVSLEQATELAPGRYELRAPMPGGLLLYYRFDLQAGEMLRLTLRTPDRNANAYATVYEGNGNLWRAMEVWNARSTVRVLEYRAVRQGRVYVSVGRPDRYENSAEAVYLFERQVG